MLMIIITLLAALAIAAVAAWFSIVGLATLFSGAFIPVIVMASSLEVGKLVATSWVYQTWHYSPKSIKSYLILGIVVLMGITSMGIFGYLSKGHLDIQTPIKEQTILIEAQQAEIGILRERESFIDSELQGFKLEMKQLQARVDEYPEGWATKKIKVLQEQEPRRKEIRIELTRLGQEKAATIREVHSNLLVIKKIEGELVEIEGDLGPIRYVAEALGVDPDEGVRFVILLIIFAFDPMAVALVLAANISIKHRYGVRDIGKVMKQRQEEPRGSRVTTLPPMPPELSPEEREESNAKLREELTENAGPSEVEDFFVPHPHPVDEEGNKVPFVETLDEEERSTSDGVAPQTRLDRKKRELTPEPGTTRGKKGPRKGFSG